MCLRRPRPHSQPDPGFKDYRAVGVPCVEQQGLEFVSELVDDWHRVSLSHRRSSSEQENVYLRPILTGTASWLCLHLQMEVSHGFSPISE